MFNLVENTEGHKFYTSSFAIKKAGVTLTTNYKSGMQDTTL